MEPGDGLNACRKFSSLRSGLITDSCPCFALHQVVEVVTPSAVPSHVASARQRASSMWPSAEGDEMILSGLI